MSDKSNKHLYDMLAAIKTHRVSMNAAKDHALIMNFAEKGDYRNIDLGTTMNVLKKLLKRLQTSLHQYGPGDIQKDIINVSNLADMLWDKMELKKY